jgi:hypothetical protein
MGCLVSCYNITASDNTTSNAGRLCRLAGKTQSIPEGIAGLKLVFDLTEYLPDLVFDSVG